jgi:hypothetical protein
MINKSINGNKTKRECVTNFDVAILVNVETNEL